MNYLSGKHLSRRAILRGIGVAIGLPFLDAMAPAHAALARTPLRVGFIFVPHGAIIEEWTPAGERAAWQLSRNLQPLKNVQDHVVVLTNLHLKSADGHAGTPAAFLGGADKSIGQILARSIGQNTPISSLELGTECTSDLPDTFEISPRRVFDRYYGCRSAASVLDAVSDDTISLQRSLGVSDRNRLSEYLDEVRELERRVETGIPDDHVEHTRLMFDLMALGYQADLTRVQTFMMAREISYRSFPHIGVTEDFHTLSHHQFDPVKMEHLINVNTYHVTQMARFLERLKNTADGDGSLLDHSIFLYGSGMGLANSHQHDALPIFVAGGANGQLEGNRHLKYEGDVPLANLLLSIGDLAGVHLDRLGDSTGRLVGL